MNLTIILFFFFSTYMNGLDQAVDTSVKPVSLSMQLNQLLKNEPSLQGAIAGVSIRSAESGEIIYNYNGNIRLRPASNMKLLTAAAALSILGEGYRFKTDIFSDGNVNRRMLQGNLYIRGKGDPTLLKSDFDKVAAELKKQGIAIICGNLIGDDSWYDDVRYSVDLPWSDETTYYGAQVSALSASPNTDYDAGTVIIEIVPGKKLGEKATIALVPNTNYIKVISNVKTVSEEEQREIIVERIHGTNTVSLEGSIPINTPKVKEWVAVWEPTEYALNLFKQSLKEHDIKLLGNIKVGKAPEKATILATLQSMPLKDLLIPFMKLSNNGHAEVLIKEMGRVITGNGDWDNGLDVMRSEITKLGVNTNTLVVRDGSGISHINLIPANEISQLLFSIQKEDWFPSYFNSLPNGGNSERLVGGTLRNRLKTIDNVKAKTGSITTVSTLSGYIETAHGEKLIFSILLNNLMDDSKGKGIENKIVEIIASR